jgi:hypothetical protein
MPKNQHNLDHNNDLTGTGELGERFVSVRNGVGSKERTLNGDNLDYFRKRAEAELEAAQTAEHANAVRAHYLLAGYYLDLVHNEEAQAALNSSEEGRGGLDQWVLRYASKATQEHGEMTPDYVKARIAACRTAGDRASLRLWQEVHRLVSAMPFVQAVEGTAA